MSAELMLALGVGGIFAGIATALAAFGVLSAERQQVGRSLAAIEALQGASPGMLRELDKPFAERVIRPLLARMTYVGKRLTGADTSERLHRKLEYAGSPASWDVDRVLAFKVIGALGGVTLGAAVPFVLGRGVVVVVGVALVVGLAGFFAPDLVLYQAAHKRAEQMRRELPNALDLLTISVEAGLAFDAALSQVARNTTGPLAAEFFRVLQEMQIGLGRMDAMRALAERVKLPDLKSFVSAMVQADSFGIPIANVLRVQAKEMRIKRRQWAEEMAQKVPVKILFPLIFFIMPTLFIVILGPAVITMMDFFG